VPRNDYQQPIRVMRILHILDHSLPLQSGYVYRTLGIVNQQRTLGWEPVLLTSGKHHAPGPPREQIGEWEFLRTSVPTGLAARLPWLRELKIVSDLGRRLDDVVDEVRPEILHAHSPVLNVLPAIRAGRRHAIPVVYEVRALWEDAAASHGTHSKTGLRYRVTRFVETHALRRADAVTTICEGLRADAIARGVPSDKVTVIPNAVDRNTFSGPGVPDRALAASLGLCGKTVLAFSARSIPMRGSTCCCAPFLICGASGPTSPSCLSAVARKRITCAPWPKKSSSARA
jgi:glycosyltransferase involved in cell wall biosynthesis